MKISDRESGLTAERLREVLAYEPDTGIFRWRVNVGKKRLVGKVAGCKMKRGHRVIRIDGHPPAKAYMVYLDAASRLHGEFACAG